MSVEVELLPAVAAAAAASAVTRREFHHQLSSIPEVHNEGGGHDPVVHGSFASGATSTAAAAGGPAKSFHHRFHYQRSPRGGGASSSRPPRLPALFMRRQPLTSSGSGPGSVSTGSSASSSTTSVSSSSGSGGGGSLSLAARRGSLTLNFQRSISEPFDGTSTKKYCFDSRIRHSDQALLSPSCSSNGLGGGGGGGGGGGLFSAGPTKRCKVMVLPPSPTPDRMVVGTVNNNSNDDSGVDQGNSSLSCPAQPPPPSIVDDDDEGSVADVGIRGNHHHRDLGSSRSLPSSPCVSTESFSLQKELLDRRARTIDPQSLADRMMDNRGILVIDCRPFISYNVSHIRGAVNVNCCDRFNRKRLQLGKASLADLATTKEGKELLKRKTWTEVVVYDDSSRSLDHLTPSHTLFLVLSALVEDGREPVILLGGFRAFAVQHRSLCKDHLMCDDSSGSSKAGPLEGDDHGMDEDGPSSSSVPTWAGGPDSSSSSRPGPEGSGEPGSSSENRRGDHLLRPPFFTADRFKTSEDLPSPPEMFRAKDIENYPATQVLPHLFLGNMKDASDASELRRLGVKYVLNVTSKPPCYIKDPAISYKQLVAADNGLQNLRQFFDEAFEFIDRAKVDRSGVLVHCQAGISRSPTIAVAYLMKHYYPMPMAEAYKFVKARRSIISPNLNFMGQLWEFEQGLRKDQEEASSASRRGTLTLDRGESGGKLGDDDVLSSDPEEVPAVPADSLGRRVSRGGTSTPGSAASAVGVGQTMRSSSLSMADSGLDVVPCRSTTSSSSSSWSSFCSSSSSDVDPPISANNKEDREEGSNRDRCNIPSRDPGQQQAPQEMEQKKGIVVGSRGGWSEQQEQKLLDASPPPAKTLT